VDTQLLTCAKEDISLKKKLVDQMDQMDKIHNEHMQKLSNNMEKLTSSITAGFSRAVISYSSTRTANVSADRIFF